MEIVFATNNEHKLSEIRSILGDRIKVRSLKDIGCDVDIPETGKTLEENALQKAQYVYDHYHMDVFADDTGLEVEALNGAPGIYSARYASMAADAEGNTPASHDSEANMTRLLKELGDNDNRRARFRTVIALIQKKDVCPCGCTSIKDIHRFEGIVNGEIIRERRGGEGFGYDPIFQPEGYDKTFAELGMEIKNGISHRARAVQKLADYLLRFITVLPLLLLAVMPLSAQVGTWRNHLAYHEVQDICSTGDDLFVLASNGLYQYNLSDQSITAYDKTNGLSDTHITNIAWSSQARRLIAVYADANIDLVETNGNVINISALYAKSMTEDKTITDIRIDGIYAYLITGFGILKVNMQKAEIAETYTTNHPNYPTELPERSHEDYDKYIATISTLSPPGPDYNYFYESKFAHNRLYTTAGFFLSGMPDPQRPGIIQVYDNDDWTTYEENISDKTGYSYLDMCCIDVDPNDADHVFAGGRTGLYEFRNGALVKFYNKDNSPLKGATDRGKELGNNYVLILSIKFDAQGHLWIINSQANGINILELDGDGNWTDHHSSVLETSEGIGFQAFRSMFFDSRGLLWFVNNNWLEPAVFCCDTENDVVVEYNDFTNQDGTKYKIHWVYCACEDKEGNIWIGTDSGPFMIQKGEVGQSTATFYQVKVPRNDGTNYADYLLSGVSISSIAIDGGNRKWFGTNGAGAFLISADNMEEIHSFTTNNSKLISNDIAYISINPQSGEVFFLSDDGLCSYLSDATEPVEEMNSDNVYAYPNPVTPDYTGLITVTGLSYDADVKVTSSSGALIAEGRSNGGMFTWDGCDKKGRRVASGIYMIVTATQKGDKGVVCKVAVIN